MLYKIEFKKSDDVSIEDFESAFRCSVDSIESVLHDQNFIIESKKTYVLITDEAGLSSLPELKKLLKNCFISSTGNLFYEFTKIEIFSE